jgi:hypothetical protein
MNSIKLGRRSKDKQPTPDDPNTNANANAIANNAANSTARGLAYFGRDADANQANNNGIHGESQDGHRPRPEIQTEDAEGKTFDPHQNTIEAATSDDTTTADNKNFRGTNSSNSNHHQRNQQEDNTTTPDLDADLVDLELMFPVASASGNPKALSSVYSAVHIDRTESRVETETLIDAARKSHRFSLQDSEQSQSVNHDVYVEEEDEAGRVFGGNNGSSSRKGTLIGKLSAEDGLPPPPPPPPGSPALENKRKSGSAGDVVESDDEYPNASGASANNSPIVPNASVSKSTHEGLHIPLIRNSPNNGNDGIPNQSSASIMSPWSPGPTSNNSRSSKPLLPAPHRRKSVEGPPSATNRRPSLDVTPEMRRHSHDVADNNSANGSPASKHLALSPPPPIAKKPSIFSLPSLNKSKSKEDTLGELRSPNNSDRGNGLGGRKESLVMMKLKRTASVIKNATGSNEAKQVKETKLRKEMTSFFKEENPNLINMNDLEKKLGIQVTEPRLH